MQHYHEEYRMSERVSNRGNRCFQSAAVFLNMVEIRLNNFNTWNSRVASKELSYLHFIM